MFEWIAPIAAMAATIGGYMQSRHFVRGRLTYVDAVQSPMAPLVAGAGAVAVGAVAVALLPVVGAGTAVLFGLGVGSGVAAGARDIRRRLGPGA